MKAQKSIIKELKTYEHNLYKTTKERKNYKISDFPNLSRKPIEWTDCDQFIKLRQQKCEKKLAIKLCQQYKIHRSEQQFYDTLHNVNIQTDGFKKIQSSASFLLRQIKQNQISKQRNRLEFQESQFDQRMSSILDNSFQKFQKSLDKHLEIHQEQEHTFNLKCLTKEQLLQKLQKMNEKPKKSLRTEIAKSSFSIHKNSLHGNINSIHQSQTERKYSNTFSPSPTLQRKQQNFPQKNFSQAVIKLSTNEESYRSLKNIKKALEERRNIFVNQQEDQPIKSMQYIKGVNEVAELKQHKRHFTNVDFIQHLIPQ